MTLLGVASNSLITHPQDGPEALADQVMERWRPICSTNSTVSQSPGAARTPSRPICPDGEGTQTLRYRGQLDGSRPGNALPVDGHDLRAALEAVLKGDDPDMEQQPSIGCNIKWHPGQEPRWFGETA